MGAFLHIGLRIRLSMSKDEFAEQTADIMHELESVVDLSIYESSETAHELVWSIKPTLLEKELVPFLRKQFRLLADEGPTNDHQRVLAELGAIKTVDELQNWCTLTRSYPVRWNGYDSLTLGQGRRRRHVAVEQLVFVSEGKIIMEEWGGILDYIERLITLANPEYGLAKAACISIV